MPRRKKSVSEDHLGLTLSEAALASGRHVQTIRRSLDTGRFPGAALDERGRWRVPIEDLTAAGYTVDSSRLAMDTQGNDRLAKLEAENQRLRTRLAVAEALAEERRQIIDRYFSDQRTRRT
jgi:hypothetical protein